MSRGKSAIAPIEQYDASGNLIMSYDTLMGARRGLKIGFSKLEEMINTGCEYKGFTLKAAGALTINGRPLKRDASVSRQPWEGANGYFDINGWSKTVF